MLNMQLCSRADVASSRILEATLCLQDGVFCHTSWESPSIDDCNPEQALAKAGTDIHWLIYRSDDWHLISESDDPQKTIDSVCFLMLDFDTSRQSVRPHFNLHAIGHS